MKKYIARILTVAMMLGLLCAQAYATDSYEEITLEGMDYYTGITTGKVVLSQARSVSYDWGGTAYYAVPEEVTVTVTPYENGFHGTSLIGVRYYNRNELGGGSATFHDVKCMLLTSSGVLNEIGERIDSATSKKPEYQMTANQDYTFTVKTDAYDVVEILCSTYTDMGIGDVAELRFDGTPTSPTQTPAETTDPTQTTSAFTDVAATAYYADAVAWAVEKGVTSGTTATTFSPDTTCTTAQILTFLWRANGSPAPAGSNANVPAGQYYSDAANWALEKGLTDTFNADTPATRAATVTYLWKLADRPDAGMPSFADVAADSDYAQAVAWAVKNGITVGTSDTTFSPSNTCTRGQIVTFLYRDLAK